MKMNDFLILLGACFCLNISVADEAPVYQNNTLIIPRVDTQELIGQYQNATFKLAPDGRWDLIHFNGVKPAKIDSIELLTISTYPVQILVSVSGYFPSACYALGQIFKRREGNRFEVAVNQVELQTLVACTQALVPFQITIPLDVYGLEKGSYQVIVNNQSGSFELPADNLISSK